CRSAAAAIAAAPLPAARQITRPFGAGRRCAESTTSGCAAATAASKIARKRERRSVMVDNGGCYGTGGLVSHPIAAKENTRGEPRGCLRLANGPIGFPND